MNEFNFSNLIDFLRRKWKVIIVINMIFLGVGVGISTGYKELWRSNQVIKEGGGLFSNSPHRVYSEINQYSENKVDKNMFDNKYLLDVFLSTFNSDVNKLSYLKLNSADEQIKGKLDLINYQQGSHGYYTLQYSSGNKVKSQDLLASYIDYTRGKAIELVSLELSSLKENTLKSNHNYLTLEMEKANFLRNQKLKKLEQALVVTKEIKSDDLARNIVISNNEGTGNNDSVKFIMLGVRF